MKATSSQGNEEITPLKPSSAKLHKLRSTESKQKRGQNIVNEEGSEYKNSEKKKDKGSQVKISDSLSDILENGALDKESIRAISFFKKEGENYYVGSKYKTSEREKDEDDAKDIGSDINMDQESSIRRKSARGVDKIIKNYKKSDDL